MQSPPSPHAIAAVTYAIAAVTHAIGVVTHAFGAVTHAFGAVTHAIGAVTPAIALVTPAFGAVTYAFGAVRADMSVGRAAVAVARAHGRGVRPRRTSDTMPAMANTPPNSPDPVGKPFVAGLPQGPLWRPMCYDGPLVCPFYGPDHPARQDEESTEAFNEDVARLAFGNQEIDRLQVLQRPSAFRGDWWLLAGLHQSCASARLMDPDGVNKDRFAQWNGEFDSRSSWTVGIQTHLEGAYLVQLDLSHIHLHSAHLQNCHLSESRLHDSNLVCARLDNITAGGVRLDQADLSASSLRHAKLPASRLTGANLAEADAEHALLWNCFLDDTNLTKCDLRHASLFGSLLDRANLREANLTHADMKNASLASSVLAGARLEDAILRGMRGSILFNDNPEHRMDIEGHNTAPWLVLRRKYTGPMFFVHLLLLIGFLLPYAAKVLTLTTTARGYNALRTSLEAGDAAPPGAEVVRAWLDHFDAAHTDTQAWWVLLGGTHDWWPLMVGTAVCVLMYNGLRGYLTLTIGVLRDQADRVERTPTLFEYYGHCHPLAEEDAGWRCVWAVWWRHVRKWWKGKHRWKNKRELNPLPVIGPWHLHQLARALFWISVASVALHVGTWLWRTTVPVPN